MPIVETQYSPPFPFKNKHLNTVRYLERLNQFCLIENE